MCYDDNANPPNPPGTPGKAHGEQIVLTASDGNQFHAYLALPEAPSKNAIVIYPDVRGLHNFYKELALRFAEVGIAAIAVDYFGRTAGLTDRSESFDFGPHVQQITLENFIFDVDAAMVHLRSKVGADAAVFVTGFCMGGSLVLMTGTHHALGAKGLIPFYAGVSRTFGEAGSVLDNASKVQFPVLGFFGGDDPGIPESAVQQIDAGLDEAGVEHRLIIYPGTPHSFFDRKFEEYATESADAWSKLLAFIETHAVPMAA